MKLIKIQEMKRKITPWRFRGTRKSKSTRNDANMDAVGILEEGT